MSATDLLTVLDPDGASSNVDPGTSAPLPARMRPRTLDDIVGQSHILSEGRLLRRVIESDRLPNLIFYGPPGCGKTSLAEVIARVTRRRFVRTSGVIANVATLRQLLEEARKLRDRIGTILFIDEIHRFNKAQQDVLLPFAEDGTVTLIGATTHNPQVFIIGPLTSRSLVFELRPLDEEAIETLVRSTLADNRRGLGGLPVRITSEASAFLARVCEGDARRALTALEVAALSTLPDADGVINITGHVMQDCVQRKLLAYDRDEDGHYDTISAFIKSVRGSDVDAAVYWLAKMLYAGEDPRFIARRLLILASEDIGNADPRGLTLASAATQAVEFVGMPEARIILAQATTYLACAPKSNAAYLAIERAYADVGSGRTASVPEHLKNLHVKAIGGDPTGVYRYPHETESHFIPDCYLETPRPYYLPSSQGYEDVIGRRMRHWQSLRDAAAKPGSGSRENMP